MIYLVVLLAIYLTAHQVSMKLEVSYSAPDIELEKNLGIAIGVVSLIALIFASK